VTNILLLLLLGGFHRFELKRFWLKLGRSDSSYWKPNSIAAARQPFL
jgi:hypothetical protein